MMNAPLQEHRHYGFAIGLAAGTVLGAGLALYLSPRMASELRSRVAESARHLGRRASDEYQQASSRVGDAVDDLTQRAQSVRDDAAEAVARGAREVERVAVAAKSGRA